MLMAPKKSALSKWKMAKIDEMSAKELKDAMKTRVQKGLADPFKRDQISLREATRLARTTESWKGMLWELKNKPRRKK